MQSFLDLAGVPCGFGEQDQTEWPRHEVSRGQDGGHSLAHLRQAYRILALHGQRPPPPECSEPLQEWEPLRRRQGQEDLGLRLDCQCLVEALIQVGCKVLGHHQAIGMGQRLGQD